MKNETFTAKELTDSISKFQKILDGIIASQPQWVWSRLANSQLGSPGGSLVEKRGAIERLIRDAKRQLQSI